MKCVILAAGYATRMFPLTRNFPKPLLPVAGKPILDWLLEDLNQSQQIDEYWVVSNHRFYSFFSDWAKRQHCSITVLDDGTSSQETRLGAVRDTALAVKQIDGDEDILVMAGDNLLDFSLAGFIDFSVHKGSSCVMCHEELREEALQRTAVITIDENRRILSFQEKPDKPDGHLAVPPFYIYKKADVCRIQEALDEGCNADSPGSFAAWLSVHAPMYAYLMPGRRYDVGNLQSYQMLQNAYHPLSK